MAGQIISAVGSGHEPAKPSMRERLPNTMMIMFERNASAGGITIIKVNRKIARVFDLGMLQDGECFFLWSVVFLCTAWIFVQGTDHEYVLPRLDIISILEKQQNLPLMDKFFAPLKVCFSSPGIRISDQIVSLSLVRLGRLLGRPKSPKAI